MAESEQSGTGGASPSKSTRGLPTVAGGAAAGGAAVGGLAAKLGGVGLAAAGTAVAIPAAAVIGIGIVAGAGVGGLLGGWPRKLSILDQRERHQWAKTRMLNEGLTGSR